MPPAECHHSARSAHGPLSSAASAIFRVFVAITSARSLSASTQRNLVFGMSGVRQEAEGRCYARSVYGEKGVRAVAA